MSAAPGSSDVPDGHLLVDQLRFMARQGPDRVAYADLDADATITFREWDERSNQAARWLIAHGVAKQDRVALYMDSDHCLQWIVAYAGIHKAGAVAVPVNTRLSIDEVLTILRHAEPAAVITNDRLIDNVRCGGRWPQHVGAEHRVLDAPPRAMRVPMRDAHDAVADVALVVRPLVERAREVRVEQRRVAGHPVRSVDAWLLAGIPEPDHGSEVL